MVNRSARQRALRFILNEKAVYTHQELVPLLAERGHVVTQSTVSRDLRELGAVKIQEGSGRARYTLAAVGNREDPASDLAQVLDDYAQTIRASGNLVVITTPPGAAQVMARAVDTAQLPGVLGTVAGDDTALVVVEEEKGGRVLAVLLEDLGGQA